MEARSKVWWYVLAFVFGVVFFVDVGEEEWI